MKGWIANPSTHHPLRASSQLEYDCSFLMRNLGESQLESFVVLHPTSTAIYIAVRCYSSVDAGKR